MSGRALPEDAEAYVALSKKKALPSSHALRELEDTKESEINRKMSSLRLEAVDEELEEMRKRRKANVPSPQQTENFATQLFKDKTPEQIHEIVKGLTPEMIQKLQMLAQATDPYALAFKQQQSTQPVAQGKSETDRIIDMLRLFKEMQPHTPAQQGLTLEGVAALLQAVKPQQDGMEVVKVASALNQPIIEMVKVASDTNRGKDKEIFELKLKELRDNQPPDPIEQIKYFKEASQALGLGNSKSEIDLKLEEMRQNQNIDLKRLDWEQKKYEMEQDAENAKWEQFAKILQGPIGQAVSNIGSAGADRVRGGRGAPRTPRTVQTECPNCLKAIWVDADAETAICGNCGVALQRGTPPPNQPTPPPQPRQPEPTPATPEDQTTNEEQTQEEEESESEEETAEPET